MFTGIIEEIGIIKKFSKISTGAIIEVECKNVLENTKIGDSIAIDGCCQTVVSLTKNSFSANVSLETLNLTTFKTFTPGRKVNLERALTPSSRMGGHIVQGHVDCVGKYLGSMNFEIPEYEIRYVVHKGSITIDGVSLTIAKLENNIIHIAVIPHTLDQTTLKDIKPGDKVNIETDILGRYVERFLTLENNNSKLNENFLKENGF